MTSRIENLGHIGFGCLQLEGLENEEQAVDLIVNASLT